MSGLIVRRLITVADLSKINMETLEAARKAAEAPVSATLDIVKIALGKYEVTFSWEEVTRD